MSHLKNKLELYFDGGNEKGIATWAVLAKSDGKVIAKLTGLVDPSLPQTNNVAEWNSLYMAAVYAYVVAHFYDEIKISGDSELVVKQINQEYVVGKEHLKQFYAKTLRTLSMMGKNYEVIWIPREQNTEVDALGRTIR